MTDPNSAPKEFISNLATEVDARGLGDRISELGADQPMDARDLIGYRFGLADATAVPTPDNPKVTIEMPRTEGLAPEFRETRGYKIGQRVARILENREWQEAA
jgi:hypothetical protein